MLKSNLIEKIIKVSLAKKGEAWIRVKSRVTSPKFAPHYSIVEKLCEKL